LDRFFTVDNLKSPRLLGNNIKVEYYDSGKADVIVDSKTDSFLVFSEFFYPGWKATINSRNSKIYNFAEFVQAVKISPGKNIVSFRYDPAGLKILIVISVVMQIFICIICAKTLLKKAIYEK